MKNKALCKGLGSLAMLGGLPFAAGANGTLEGAASAPAYDDPSKAFLPDRTVLPIHEPKYKPITTLDARDVKAPVPFQVEAPKGAPNVVIILVDDLGFAGTSHFGGPVQTPTFDRLAGEGLSYNQFHSTALCSPTRQALKTGRNHHSGNQSKISEVATSIPGATGQLPNDVATIATMLQYNGYSTGAFGKWHETAVWEISPSGPMNRWPHQQGFEKFYGFLGGETNQWAPGLYDGMTPIEPPDDPDYHLMTDMTNQAINWTRFQQSLTPDKPFFTYFAPGATHAPHHVPEEYIAKQKGRFDAGWDVMREQIFERQLASGVIPPGTKLAPKPDDIKDWADLKADQRKLFARQAEVFAAYVDMTDHEIGRYIQALENMGELDNTLIFYIAGDNGSSAEGGENGLYNEMSYFNADPDAANVEDMLEHYDEWGSASTYPHMASGWAVCFDTPFTWTKQVASNYGGTRQGLAIHWPDGIKADGGLRTQWHHVIDVVPTVLEAAGLPEPEMVDGVPQRPIEGVSMMYSFDNPDAADRHTRQYFEMLGNRGVYDNGWFAGTVHLKPWGVVENRFSADVWELYKVNQDFSMAENLAARYPEKLAELQQKFLDEAVKYSVLPLDDRRFELFNPNVAGRPDLMFGRKSLTLYEGMGHLLENDFINIKNSSFAIEADLETDGSNTNGVIVAQGGYFGGWSFYIRDGKPVFAYNYLGKEIYKTTGTRVVPTGSTGVKITFDYAGGSTSGKPVLGAGGKVSLFIDGVLAGTGTVPVTQPVIFSADETANVGIDRETMVSDDYTYESSKFVGRIDKVVITLP